jgi:predicted AlkP superfamily pyrophosphatase or phosphodiesterase
MDRAIAQMDSALGRLIDGISALPHGEQVHVIVVSDHGMTSRDGRVVVLDDHAELDDVVVVTATTLAHLYFHGDTVRRDAVKRALDRAPHVRVFLREQVPAEWGVAENPRAGDILIVADEGAILRRRNGRAETTPATHGWAPSPNMRGIFVAAGPGIRAGMRIPAFENIHIYPLMATLLELEPARDIDGRLDVLSPILVPPAARRAPAVR